MLGRGAWNGSLAVWGHAFPTSPGYYRSPARHEELKLPEPQDTHTELPRSLSLRSCLPWGVQAASPQHPRGPL